MRRGRGVACERGCVCVCVCVGGAGGGYRQTPSPEGQHGPGGAAEAEAEAEAGDGSDGGGDVAGALAGVDEWGWDVLGLQAVADGRELQASVLRSNSGQLVVK